MKLLRPLLPAALLAAMAVGTLSAVELAELEDGSTAKLTSLGNVQMAQGRYETAIAHYQQALAVDRTYFTALYNLGLAFQQLGNREKARQWYLEALRARPDHPEVLCNLGVIAYQDADYRTAADRFTEAARMAASSPRDQADYWFNAGTALERGGNLAQAQRAYEECLAADGRHYGGHYNLGTLLLGALGDGPQSLRQAQSHLAAAAEIAPDRPEAWLNLALCHEQTGSGDAEADFAAAARAAANDVAQLNRVRWQRALWLDRRQPPQKTALREELRRILADDAAFPDANGLLGQYLYDIADFDRAVEHLERECARDPGAEPSRTWLESHYLLAVIYTDHRPDPVKALGHAQEYYKRRPDAPKIHELRRRALRLSAAMGVAAESARGGASSAATRPPAAPQREAPAHPAPAAAPAHGPAPAAPAVPAAGHH